MTKDFLSSNQNLQLLYAGAVYKDMDSSGIPVAKSVAVYIAHCVDAQIAWLTEEKGRLEFANGEGARWAQWARAEIERLRAALERVKLEAPSLADAQVIAMLTLRDADETSEQREDRIRTADFEPGEFAADEFKCGMPSCPGHEDMTQVCESAYGAASKTDAAPACAVYGFVPDSDGQFQVNSCVYCGLGRADHK